MFSDTSLLGRKFKKYQEEISSDDFKEIAKLAVKYIPTQAKNPTDIESMPETKLEEIANNILNDFIEIKRQKSN